MLEFQNFRTLNFGILDFLNFRFLEILNFIIFKCQNFRILGSKILENKFENFRILKF